jgi:regulator of sirC expression with transglutaminase-like and TPR domain
MAQDMAPMVDDIAYLGLVDETEIELDKAALEIAALDHPRARVSRYLALLEQIAERLRARGGTSRTPAAQAEALAEVLGADFGFEGDRDTYDDPANADLIRVLDRRRGLPVALAILYVALARRLGWTAHALNTPGHVLVGVGQPRALLIDPFNRGALVGREQFATLFLAAGGRPAQASESVAPLSNRGVLTRLMMNQVTRAERTRRLPRALAVLERVTTVAPDYSLGWWERARVEQALGDPAAARLSLSSMLETTRDPDLRSHVMNALDALSG